MTDDEATPKAFGDNRRLLARGYHVGVGFAPNLALVRKEGLRLAARMQEYVELQQITLEEKRWQFGRADTDQGEAGGRFVVTVRSNGLQVEQLFPGRGLERFEERLLSILKVFGEIMGPKVVLQSGALTRFTLGLDMDARAFLAQRKLRLDKGAMEPFGRPVHVIGLRLFFPPVAGREGAEARDWQVNVKIESLAKDPTQLFIEADAHWNQPMQWGEQALSKIVERADTVHTFVRTNVLNFLRHEAGA